MRWSTTARRWNSSRADHGGLLAARPDQPLPVGRELACESSSACVVGERHRQLAEVGLDEGVVLARDARGIALGAHGQDRVGEVGRECAASRPSRITPSLMRCCRSSVTASLGVGVERVERLGAERARREVRGQRLRRARAGSAAPPPGSGPRARRSARERARAPAGARRASARAGARPARPRRGARRQAEQNSATTSASAASAKAAASSARTHLNGLRLEADLAVLGLEAEVHGLGALLGEDARGLLRDQLLEALELHGAALAGLSGAPRRSGRTARARPRRRARGSRRGPRPGAAAEAGRPRPRRAPAAAPAARPRSARRARPCRPSGRPSSTARSRLFHSSLKVL